jgi:hypothetical protein
VTQINAYLRVIALDAMKEITRQHCRVTNSIAMHWRKRVSRCEKMQMKMSEYRPETRTNDHTICVAASKP